MSPPPHRVSGTTPRTRLLRVRRDGPRAEIRAEDAHLPVANIMGINAGTVRTHRRLARKRIATKLGIDLGDDEEKE